MASDAITGCSCFAGLAIAAACVVFWFFKVVKSHSAALKETERKESISKQEIDNLVKEQKAQKIPWMEIYKKLWAMAVDDQQDDAMREAAHRAADKIEGTLVGRNIKGQAAEKSGDTDQAIRLYEKNISDKFDGSHPYERLRILYNSMGRTNDIRRVLAAYIENSAQDKTLVEKYNDILAKLE